MQLDDFIFGAIVEILLFCIAGNSRLFFIPSIDSTSNLLPKIARSLEASPLVILFFNLYYF